MASHQDHDDFGGLHRDLLATGAAMDRRGLFRMAAQLGAGLGAFSLASDNVFSDGSSLELATITGNLAAGLTATLTVGV